MPRVESDLELTPSILDRLIDRTPREPSEPPLRASQRLAQVKDAVKRDLEWLLNSRQLLADWPSDMQHLTKSLLTFGMPDFSSAMLSNPHDQDRLRRVVQEAISRFDPRLAAVQVTLVEGREYDRTLRFRIDAMLRVEPSPVPVTFDSVLELGSKAFVVEGDRS